MSLNSRSATPRSPFLSPLGTRRSIGQTGGFTKVFCLYMPAKELGGDGVVAQNAPLLAGLGTRCLLVTGKNSARISGALEDVTAALDSQGIPWQVFDGIGQKVGSVLEFVGSKMGWIQNIIGTVAPVVADILITAWGVISPVMDLAISVFKLLFNVVQTVFNGIASVVSSVWSKVKPIVEGIGNGLSWVAGKVKGLLGMGGGDGGSVGSNAEGTNNRRGGPTFFCLRCRDLLVIELWWGVICFYERVEIEIY